MIWKQTPLWMKSHSSELFPNRELFLDTTLSCHWSYGMLDEVLQQWTLSQLWTVLRCNTLLSLDLQNSGWGPAEMKSSQSQTLPRHTIALLFVPIMDSTNIYRKKTFFNMILIVINRIILKGINWTQYQVLQPWTKCLLSHNWSCESLLQSLQWTNCLSSHNGNCESLFCIIAKDIEGITAGFSFKFNFLISCSCHACNSGLFTYFLLCDSTIDNVLWHAHEMLFSCHIRNVT